MKLLAIRAHGFGFQARAEPLLQRQHGRIGLERLTSRAEFLLRLLLFLPRRCVQDRLPQVNLDTHGFAQVATEGLRQPFDQRRRAQQLLRGVEPETQQSALAAHESAMGGQLARRTAQALTDQGASVTRLTDHRPAGREHTEIQFRSGFEALKSVPWNAAGKNPAPQKFPADCGAPRGSGIAT